MIDYGVPIANDIGEDANMISVDICAGANGNQPAGNSVKMTTDKKKIEISVASCAVDETINVGGVLVSLDGSGATSVTATISATGSVRLGGANNELTLVDNVVDPLIDDNIKVGQTLELIRHTGKASGEALFKLVITEAHNDSFDGTQLELEFSGIPEGVKVTELDAWVTTAKAFGANPGAAAALGNQVPVTMMSAPDPADPDATIMVGSRSKTAADKNGEATVFLQDAYRIPAVEAVEAVEGETEAVAAVGRGGGLDSGAVDVVVVTGKVSGADAAKLLPIDLDIDVTVDLGPTGDADEFDHDDGPPLFESDRTAPVTVIESTSAQTKLSAPFVIAGSGTGLGGYETGIAVANMSSGRNAQPGTITFDFYPATGVNAGEKMTYTTTASGMGSQYLDTAGMLEPGGTYAVLLGQLFPDSGNGHLVITTNFMKGDANVYISDFKTFSATGTIRMSN